MIQSRLDVILYVGHLLLYPFHCLNSHQKHSLNFPNDLSLVDVMPLWRFGSSYSKGFLVIEAKICHIFHIMMNYREEDGEWIELTKLEAHSDWVRDVAWAPPSGLQRSQIASCSQVMIIPLVLSLIIRKIWHKWSQIKNTTQLLLVWKCKLTFTLV